MGHGECWCSIASSCICNAGFTGDGTSCAPFDPCIDLAEVDFVKNDYTSDADCIAPDVCLTRRDALPLYNAVAEMGSDLATSPAGTLWATMSCASAQAADFTDLYGAFGGSIGNSIVDLPMCLQLVDQGLEYDVVFHSWTSAAQGGGFSYTRTAVVPDGCGNANATCDSTGGVLTCTCPTGYETDATTGVCRLPDPCDATNNACDASASCRRVGLTGHRCECDATYFVKDEGSRAESCLRDDICLARGDVWPLYNSMQEDFADNGTCTSPKPTLTLWSDLPCASAAPADFGTFISGSFSGCWLPKIVGVHGCLLLEASGANPESTWDIQFDRWDGNGTGGGFGYWRWHEVGDGVACP